MINPGGTASGPSVFLSYATVETTFRGTDQFGPMLISSPSSSCWWTPLLSENRLAIHSSCSYFLGIFFASLSVKAVCLPFRVKWVSYRLQKRWIFAIHSINLHLLIIESLSLIFKVIFLFFIAFIELYIFFTPLPSSPLPFCPLLWSFERCVLITFFLCFCSKSYFIFQC